MTVYCHKSHLYCATRKGGVGCKGKRRMPESEVETQKGTSDYEKIASPLRDGMANGNVNGCKPRDV